MGVPARLDAVTRIMRFWCTTSLGDTISTKLFVPDILLARSPSSACALLSKLSAPTHSSRVGRPELLREFRTGFWIHTRRCGRGKMLLF